MADIRISQLPVAPAPIDGTELVPVVQNGLTVQTTVSAITQSPSLTATFLTVNQEPLLPNSRALSAGVGIGITDGGAQSTYNLSLNGTSGSLEGASTGVIVKSAANTISARTLTASGNGISVTDGNGVSGNPTFQLTGLAAAIANMSGTGLVGLNSTTLTPLTLIGVANEISVADGNGAGGNPTIGIADNAVFPGVAGVTLPNGTTAERGATLGQIRYNTTSSRFEGNYGTGWQNFGTGDGAIASVVGTNNQIVVSTVGGAATVSIDPDPVLPGSGAVQIPAGATGSRPGGVNGQLRYNSDTQVFEGYANGVWGDIAVGGGVTSVGTGTGLTGGPITSTGTISIANTAVAAGSYGSATAVPTYTVNAQGQLTAAANVSIAIPSSAITDKGLPNGVATLDSGGKVPVSELPAAVLGALSYQGTWNASTNTPTLTSSVGTKGYYYVVNVAGTTNLDGITDWQIGDWVVFNGAVWQKVDNTDAVTSVNGYTGTVVLTASDVGAPTTSGTGATGTWAIAISGNAATATTSTNIAGGAAGSLPYQSAASTTGMIAAGTNGYLLTMNAGIPSWQPAPATGVTSFSAGTTGLTPSTGTTGAVTLAGTLGVANGGTGLTSVTANRLPYGNGTNALQTSANLTFDGTTLTNTGNAVISDNSTNAALRITQTGTGNALLVEDSANPDATPVVIDADGRLVVGNTSFISTTGYVNDWGIQNQATGAKSNVGLFRWAADAFSSTLHFLKSRNGTVGTQAVVLSGDSLGGINFRGSDGTGFVAAASMEASVDGTPGTNDMPGRLVFSTTADGASSPTERMRINSSGNVGIGGTGNAQTNLYLQKDITGSTAAYSLRLGNEIQSDVTSSAFVVRTDISTQAASFALTNLRHYFANQGAIGAGSSVGNQYGFVAESSLTGATNNYGFYSNIASGTGRWNFYAAGTADNYFAGKVGIGTTTPTNALTVEGLTEVRSGNYLMLRPTGNSWDMRLQAVSTQLNFYSGGDLVNPIVSMLNGGNVGVGTSSPAVRFAINSTDAILVPVGTTAQRPTGATGYIRYNSTTGGFEGYSGASWGSLGGGNTTTYGLWENNATISANYTITAGNNAMSAGPITVASGVVVTVPSGSTWTIV